MNTPHSGKIAGDLISNTIQSDSDAFVSFANVTKTYDGRSKVVDGLYLDIRKGEFLTLLGPSGSGKTTTLMMLAGFETLTSGEIFLDGSSLSNKPPHLRHIGMVFQNYALFPHMTVAENIAFPLEVRGVARAEIGKLVAKALDMVRLPNVGDRRPAQLSGGQQQRIALARALVFEPRLVLMDEPLGALDKQLREHMQYEIRALHQRLGVTVVYVTHDQTEALTMSDRIAVFDSGRVRQLADPKTVYQQPSDGFVATFVGEGNRLDGMLSSIKDGWGQAILADGTAIGVVPVDARAGEPGMIVVRPEHVRVAGPDEAMVNGLETIVEDVVFRGDRLIIRLRTRGGGELIAQLNIDHATPRIGANVRAGFEAGNARIYDKALMAR